MRLELHSEARAEFLDAVSYYDDAAAGLGARFVDEIERCTDLIMEAPLIVAPFGRKVRRLVSGGDFPYPVIYAQRTDAIFVVAFTHGSRRPGYWRRRVAR